jgi:hypothetical protein
MVQKHIFDQADSRDMFKRNPKKFTLYFSEVHSIFYEFLKFEEFLEYLNQNTFLEIEKGMSSSRLVLGPRPHGAGPAHWRTQIGWPKPTTRCGMRTGAVPARWPGAVVRQWSDRRLISMVSMIAVRGWRPATRTRQGLTEAVDGGLRGEFWRR